MLLAEGEGSNRANEFLCEEKIRLTFIVGIFNGLRHLDLDEGVDALGETKTPWYRGLQGQFLQGINPEHLIEIE